MKKKDSFFQMEPPEGHDERVAKAVQDSLRRNQVVSSSGGESSGIGSWKIWSMGFSTAAIVAVGSYLLLKQNPEENLDLLAFGDLFDGSESDQDEDIEVLAQEIDILENLDLLEAMEEES